MPTIQETNDLRRLKNQRSSLLHQTLFYLEKPKGPLSSYDEEALRQLTQAIRKSLRLPAPKQRSKE